MFKINFKKIVLQKQPKCFFQLSVLKIISLLFVRDKNSNGKQSKNMYCRSLYIFTIQY